MSDALPALLHGFFHNWLAEQRNASHHTILAYRDAWRLFLRFAADRTKSPVAKLTLNDLTATEILAFLQHVEVTRGASVATRNCRLAALRSFFLFVADREPAMAAQCAAVLRIPSKKKPKRAVCYLEAEEVAAILAQPDQTTLLGQRDHTLLAFLYNTGARIQEALDVCPKHLRLESPAHVQLFGKGRKERFCPLWPETVALVLALLRRQPRHPDENIFCNRYGHKLGASGVRFQVRQYIEVASKKLPSLSAKRISPHTFRHTTAVHLIAAGVDVTVISSWLGHAHLDTTNHYAQANLQTKRNALEHVAPESRPSKPPRWKQDQDLLAWLDSL
jgi:site-specific recombinase XerD